MKLDNFKNSFDSALLAHRVLKRLKCNDIDSFQGRLRMQKTHYLAQLFGVSPSYPYNLYIRGPYSPDLANDLFEIKKANVEIKSFRFVSEEIETRFQKIKQYIETKTTRQLELISTLHWLVKCAKYQLKDALEILKELKGIDNEKALETLRLSKGLL